MELSAFSFLLFTLFSGLRIVSYIPQIRKVATDTNGASAISYATWGLWTGANIATALYAAVNLGDGYLAAVSALYACCCITVIMLTAVKRRRLQTVRHSPSTPMSGRGAIVPPELRLGSPLAAVPFDVRAPTTVARIEQRSR
jgi:hypothetical protein